MLEVRVLGEVAVRRDGVPVRLSAKQRVLLAHLVVARGVPLGADPLVEALALGANKDPRHALEAHVSRLRQRLGVAVASVNGGYALAASQARVDVDEFLDAVATAEEWAAERRLVEAGVQFGLALEMWHDQPFKGLDDHDLLAQEAVRLASVHERAESALIDVQLLTGQARAALERLHVLVEVHPLRERHWGQLLAALHAAGRSAEAVDCFDRARRRIDDALGIRPGQRLAAIHRAILQDVEARDVVALAVDLPSGPSGHLRTETSTQGEGEEPEELVRLAELGVLIDAVRESTTRSQWVILTGGAGAGKTHLLDGFVVRARAEGVEVHHASGVPGAADAFGPVRDILRRDLARRPEDRRLARLRPAARHLVPLVADLLPGWELERNVADRPSNDFGGGRELLFDAFIQWLRHRARHRPVCVVVDDLQWADTETLHLLDAVRAARPVGVTVVLARRAAVGQHADGSAAGCAAPGEPPSDDHTRVLGLGALSAEQAERVVRIEMQQLDPHLEITPEALGTMVELADGHPLHLVELTRHWHAHRGGEFPASLLDALELRLGRVDDDVRSVLVDAALAGTTWDVELLAGVRGVRPGEVTSALERAARERLVEAVPGGGGHRFTHDLVRVALLRGVGEAAGAARRARIAEALEGRRAAGSAGGLAELGRQYAAAMPAAHPEAADYLAQAGDQAMRQHAPYVAVGFYQEGLALLPSTAATGLRADLQRGLGMAQLRTGNADGRESLLASASLAAELGDVARMTAAVVANNRGWYSDLSGCDERQLQMIDTALAMPMPDERSEALLLTAWSVEAVVDPDRRGKALQRSAQALSIGEGLGDPHLVARLLANHYSVCHTGFRPRDCPALADRLLALAEELDDPGWMLYALCERVQTRFQMGDLAVVEATLPEATALARQLRAPAQLWMLSSWQAMTSLMRGDLVEAEHQVTAAFELGQAANQPDASDWFLGQLFLIRWMGGRLQEVIEVVEEQAEELAARIPVWRAGRAMARAEVGDLAGARALVDDALDDDFALPLDMLWLPGKCFWARAATLVGHCEAAAQLHQQLLPYEDLIAHNGTVDGGPVAAHLADLAHLLGQSASALEHARRAQDWARREGARIWSERTAGPAVGSR